MSTRSPSHAAPKASATSRRGLAVFRSWGTALVAFAIFAAFAVVPSHGFVESPRASDDLANADAYAQVQSIVIADGATAALPARDSYSVTLGRSGLIAGGSNVDWAKLVMQEGGWPECDNNVTVMMRWMRQENYEKSWWNRNNPLNNGWGSGGGAGLGSYPNLVVAAENAAEALNTHPGYAGIIAGFAACSPTEVTEHAIWASPWASSHYANGSHWHYTPYDVVSAPASAWA